MGKEVMLAAHSLRPAVAPHGLTTLAHCGGGCGVYLMEHSKHDGTGASYKSYAEIPAFHTQGIYAQFPACLGIYLLIP